MKYSIHTHIKEIIDKRGSDIRDWFAKEYERIRPLFYASVDIRDSGSKIAAIDTNIFPGGFNNVSEYSYDAVAKMMDEFLNKYHPNSSRVLIIPESHTRNQFYLDNIHTIEILIKRSGREVIIGNLSNDTFLKQGSKVSVKNGKFIPDIIILNNDFSGGVPEILNGIEQPIIPALKFSWYFREKSKHFKKYDEMIGRFSRDFDLDPFFLSAIVNNCGEVNFADSKGLDCIANSVDKLIHLLANKYKEYGIEDKPYVFIKADKGTYGMGIMTATSGEEVISMNRDSRRKMHVIKEGVVNTKVIIQEGIPTINQHNGDPAEPIMYLVGGEVADYFLRVNDQRDEFGNLNKAGLKFTRFSSITQSDSDKLNAYKLIARIASLAAAME